MKKAAVFSCPGLGDGMVSLQLAYNLSLNGYLTDLFHEKNFFQLQNWTHIPIQKYPLEEPLEKIFTTYEKIFVSQDLANPWVQNLIKKGKEQNPEQLIVLNPSPSKKRGGQAFYSDTYFQADIPMVQNIFLFAQKILKLQSPTVQSPLNFPQDLPELMTSSNMKKRIIFHSTASRLSKCWPKKKFLKLLERLEKKAGFEVFFVMNEKESRLWPEVSSKIKIFPNLHELALFLSSADLFVGGDSGVGHLASALDVPTISIFRSYRNAALWRPGWGRNQVIAPYNFIPNFSGFRLRDKKWASFISVKRVEKEILSLAAL